MVVNAVGVVVIPSLDSVAVTVVAMDIVTLVTSDVAQVEHLEQELASFVPCSSVTRYQLGTN